MLNKMMLAASTYPIERVLSSIKEPTGNTVNLGPALSIFGVVALHFIVNNTIIDDSPETTSAVNDALVSNKG